jgi:uncharacterized phage protein gp47/JayE
MAKALNELAYIDESGFYVADYADFLEYHQAAFKSIYGQDVNLDADTQDGQLVAHFAQTNYDLAQTCAACFNNYSPSTARGDALSRQVKINGIARQTATNSTVDLTLTGEAGTTILNGQARDSQSLWNLPSSVVIPLSGTVTVTATANEAGAVSADAETINRIATPTEGWISVINRTKATEGRDAETDAALRARQALSTSQPSQTVANGILGALQKLDGVTRATVYENASGTAAEIPAYSIAVVVEGGDADEIAEVIKNRKTLGVATQGTTSIAVENSDGTRSTVKFYRPTEVRVKVTVYLDPIDGYSNLYENEVKEQVSNYINSLSFGAKIYRSKIFVPANLEDNTHDDTYDVTEVTLATGANEQKAQNLTLAFNEVPICELEDVEVVAHVYS